MSDSDNNKASPRSSSGSQKTGSRRKGRVLLSQFQCKMASTEIAFHIATKELCRAPEVPSTWRKRARQRDTGRQRQRQRQAPPPPRQAIAEWPSGYTMSSTMMVNVTISIATPLALVFFVDPSLLLLLPCLFPRTKKTSSDYAEQKRHTECVESSPTTIFSFWTWSSFSCSQGLELGFGESWHQTSKADSDSAQLEGNWWYKLMIQEWRKYRLQASAELASPQNQGEISRRLHIGWQSKTYPSLLEIPLSFLSNSILQLTSQKLWNQRSISNQSSEHIPFRR